MWSGWHRRQHLLTHDTWFYYSRVEYPANIEEEIWVKKKSGFSFQSSLTDEPLPVQCELLKVSVNLEFWLVASRLVSQVLHVEFDHSSSTLHVWVTVNMICVDFSTIIQNMWHQRLMEWYDCSDVRFHANCVVPTAASVKRSDRTNPTYWFKTSCSAEEPALSTINNI